MTGITPRFRAALDYAAELHATQFRKGTEIPYLSHLLAVAALAMEYRGSEDEVIAALLHDAIEDQGGKPTRVEIEKRFGPVVAAIVEGCSDTDKIPKPPWRERKIAYVAGLRNHDESTRFVSACDKLHNARSILADYQRMGDAVFDRFTGGKEGTLWYYRWLVETFKELGPRNIAQDLDRTVSELEQVAANGRRAYTPLTQDESRQLFDQLAEIQKYQRESGLEDKGYPRNYQGEPGDTRSGLDSGS